ncbi:MAG: hypothetical protein ACJAVI_004485 [Candidatus Azotimanducaceae bacterium]|jgi:hypothetical protein
MQVQGCCNKRSHFFNWVTVILLVVWVGIVTVIVESTSVPQAQNMDVDAFIHAKLVGG